MTVHAAAEDKRSPKPLGWGRIVINMAAECAITNRMTITLLRERVVGMRQAARSDGRPTPP